MAESTPELEMSTDVPSGQAEETSPEKEVEQKKSSISKLEAKKSSISKESGPRRLLVAKGTDSKKSVTSRDIEGKEPSPANDVEIQMSSSRTEDPDKPLQVSSSKSEYKEEGAPEDGTDKKEMEIEFEEVEEVYEEEVEEDGEVKTITKTRYIKVPKPKEDKPKEILEEIEVEEEYEEEIEEEGEKKMVTKTRMVKIPKPKEDKPEEDFEEEIEEEYEEEVEEDGEVKMVTKKRIVKVRKPKYKLKEIMEGTDEEEEYEEEVEDENGQIMKVKKLRKIRSFEEKEEEYESEEMDENGEMVLVKKTRMIKVPLRTTTRVPTTKQKYVDVIEDYDEEIVNEDGEKVIIRQKRVVKVLKTDSIQLIPSEEGKPIEEKEGDKKEEEDAEEGEEIEEEEDMEEEGEIGEEEEEVEEQVEEPREEGEGETREKTEKTKRRIKEKDTEGEAIEGEEKKKKRRRRRKKKKEIDEKESQKTIKSGAPSTISKKGEEDEGEEVVLREDEEEEIEAIKSLTSEELRHAEEKVEMAQQFESLMRLRNEHQALRKRTLFLTSKLIQYFKKQKMDHLFTDVRDDPEADQRLLRKLVEFHEFNQHMTEEKARINAEWEMQKTLNEDLNAEMKQMVEDLMTLKREVVAKLIDARTGRTVQHDKALEDLLVRQEQQMKQLSECRLIKIKLRRRIEMKKSEGQMDNTGGDFRLMDYEKLASLKEYYMDKITERDIEIGEVKNKIELMDENLNVIREQLKRREQEMEREQLKLHLVTTDLNKRRENLNRIKTTKHKLEKNTMRIKQQSGLLAYPTLLKDYEEKSHQLQDLKSQTDHLKQQYRNGLERVRKLKETVKRKTEAKYSLPSSVSSG